MTETAVAAALTETPLARWLGSAGQGGLSVPFRGVLTPANLTPAALDAPRTEIAALAYGAAVHDLGWLRGVRVRGEDRFRWLSGMVTNMVNDLAPDGGAWNLVLNAQGRIQGDLTVWRGSDELELEIAADQYNKLMAHLDHFIIMDDVELVPVAGVTTIGLTGPKAGELLAKIGVTPQAESLTQARATANGLDMRVFRRYGVLADHYALWVTEDLVGELWNRLTGAGAKPVGTTALDAFRIAEGIPVHGVDIAERDLPQETSQMRALHFNKGCYLGQEIVERIRSRGNVHRHLRQVEIEGPLPAPQTELTLDGGSVGIFTSSAELPLPTGARRFALAMLRAEAEVRNLPLVYTTAEGGGTARILAAPPEL